MTWTFPPNIHTTWVSVYVTEWTWCEWVQTPALTHGLEHPSLRPSTSHKRVNEEREVMAEKSGTAVHQMEENDTLLFLHSHLKGTHRCGEPLQTQQCVIWGLNGLDGQSRTCWLRSIFSLSKPKRGQDSMGFWIKEVDEPHRFDFRHVASLCCKKK